MLIFQYFDQWKLFYKNQPWTTTSDTGDKWEAWSHLTCLWDQVEPGANSCIQLTNTEHLLCTGSPELLVMPTSCCHPVERGKPQNKSAANTNQSRTDLIVLIQVCGEGFTEHKVGTKSGRLGYGVSELKVKKLHCLHVWEVIRTEPKASIPAWASHDWKGAPSWSAHAQWSHRVVSPNQTTPSCSVSGSEFSALPSTEQGLSLPSFLSGVCFLFGQLCISYPRPGRLVDKRHRWNSGS